MLTATQARKMVDDAYMPQLLKILDSIRTAAEHGEISLSLNDCVSARVRRELEQLEYRVVEQQRYSQITAQFDYWTDISW